MTDIDLEIEGDIVLQEELEELEERGETDAVYQVEAGAEYAKFLEFGTEKMPPYPFFRPAVREAQLDIDDFVESEVGTSLDTARTVQDALRMVALSLETQMKKNVTAQGATDRSPGVHPEHPKVQTGNLRASIKSERLR